MNEGMVYSWFAVVIMIIATWSLWWTLLGVPRKAAKKKAAHRQFVQAIFKEIAASLAMRGLKYEFGIEYGKYVGRTAPSSSGGYIEIRQYIGDDYMVKLRQASFDDSIAEYDQDARAVIHGRIIIALIYRSMSSNSAHFLRQNLLTLKEVGIKQVVESLVALHHEYDEVWAALEVSGVREKLAGHLELCAKNDARIMGSVDAVLNARFHTSMEVLSQ